MFLPGFQVICNGHLKRPGKRAVVEKIHTQNSFDFYSKPVRWFFKEAKDFYISGAGAKDTEWIGPIYGASIYGVWVVQLQQVTRYSV